MLIFNNKYLLRRLSFGIVFFFILTNSFSQSKKEQISSLSSQKDSLALLIINQKTTIDQLNKKIEIANEENRVLKNENQKLNSIIKFTAFTIDSLKKQLTLPKECSFAKMETSLIIDDSGDDPTIEKKAIFNGFELINKQEGHNSTYPSRLFGFKYKILELNDYMPAGLLFNSKLSSLESKLNEIAKIELLKQGVPENKIINYFFSKKLYDDSDGKINFFIEFNHVTIYLQQFMYEQV